MTGDHKANTDARVDAAAMAEFTAEHGGELPPIAIVIAAYNEERGIGDVVSAIPAVIAGHETATVVVVDGAADDTAAVARKAGALVCDVPVNRGQGAALRLGYRIARAGGARYIVTTDADGQYDPADIERILGPVLRGEADFVTGSRVLGRQETYDRVRRLGVHVFARMISLLTGQRITDTSFGMRAMRAEVTGAVTLKQPQYQSSELLIGVISRGYKVVEVPATMRLRVAGTTKKGGNLVYGYRYLRVVLGTWLRERRGAAPSGPSVAPGPSASPGSASSSSSASPAEPARGSAKTK
ncbi:glycosyltransferase family 2 protein [Nonomuraea mesophila]|uniref:Glycosyltransferase family 2 protein n=1 Tax=Nonomuraea mesophila TaxID=2530382 RepID=A0A4R5EZK9_9ACTN|nr:glycosyltransferase family 2 protein [Nonomuraea mesophila]TDE40585.1 glycosyltransferase family 2 protein [Nonomuraea mesophila]